MEYRPGSCAEDLDGVYELRATVPNPGDRLAILSLSTTKRLVELMDGELRVEQGGVEAGPDAGTSFHFTILAEVLPAGHRLAAHPRGDECPGRHRRRRPNAACSRFRSEQWGATATAATPEEALGIVKAGQPFDIAVVEHRPPAVDGLELSTNLRALKRPDQLPIVVIAAAATGPEVAEAADSGSSRRRSQSR